MKKIKKGIQLSFTFLFSLILIAVVVFVAVWAIKHFLELKEGTQIRLAIKDIEDTIKEVWQAEEASRTEKFYLPKSVKAICFANFTKKFTKKLKQVKWGNELDEYRNFKKSNLFVLPFKVKLKYDLQGAYLIKCAEIDCIEFENPTCFENKNGFIQIKFVKKAGEKVKIK